MYRTKKQTLLWMALFYTRLAVEAAAQGKLPESAELRSTANEVKSMLRTM